MKYRIKVETTKSGEKKYTPQVGTPKLSIGKFDRLWLDWENIIENREDVMSTKYARYIYDKEEDAFNMIERHKTLMIKTKKSEVESVDYINLD